MKVTANGNAGDIFDEYAAGIASMIVKLEEMSGGKVTEEETMYLLNNMVRKNVEMFRTDRGLIKTVGGVIEMDEGLC